jgi:hypothetical protein
MELTTFRSGSKVSVATCRTGGEGQDATSAAVQERTRPRAECCTATTVVSTSVGMVDRRVDRFRAHRA